MQPTCPLSGWYSPAAQGAHSAEPLVAANWPAPHSTGTTEPSGHACPAVHGRHQLSSVAPVSGLNVPAGHGRGKALPERQ